MITVNFRTLALEVGVEADLYYRFEEEFEPFTFSHYRPPSFRRAVATEKEISFSLKSSRPLKAGISTGSFAKSVFQRTAKRP